MSHSRLLRGKIEVGRPRVQQQLERFWRHTDLEELFKLHMKKLYWSVSSSVPLMILAGREAKRLSAECPVARSMVSYLEEHIQEEANHDEWLLEDIESLGVERESVLSMIPPTDVSAFIGGQYFYCMHVHPVALLSYFAVIEGYPPEKEVLDSIVGNSILPKAALRSFYKHAELDLFHSRDLWRFIDRLPLSNSHSELLGLNALMIIDQLSTILENTIDAIENG